MRKGIGTAVGLGMMAGLLSSMSAQADNGGGVAQGFYFRGGIGPEVAQRTDVNEFFGPVSGIRVKYDPGFRISAAAGYMFCNYFSAELESGVLYNSIKSITGSPDTDASLSNIGFGAGATTSVLDINRATINGTRLNGNDSDVEWAVQGFAGFRYEFNDRMAVGFGYKFLATGEPSWDVFSFSSGSGQLRFDNVRTHSFLAEFTMKF